MCLDVFVLCFFFFFFKQKTAYEMRISDWSSDVCSSDLHALKGLAQAGLGRAIVVTGYRADDVEAHLAGRNTPIPVETVRTPDWRLPNGVSARAAGALVGGQPALLAMCDHPVDPALYRRMAEAGAGQGLRLGVDRRLGHPWIDPDDVTCVEADGTRIVAIGKGIEPHNAYDTGVFAVTTPFFDVLERLESPSISMAVGVLAEYRSEEHTAELQS